MDFRTFRVEGVYNDNSMVHFERPILRLCGGSESMLFRTTGLALHADLGLALDWGFGHGLDFELNLERAEMLVWFGLEGGHVKRKEV